jgi:hypothetical protein
MKRFRPRLTFANVIASLALFIALGGAAVAAGLPKNSVGPNQLKRGAVTPKALRKAAVTSGKIAPSAVTAGKLGPNAVLPGNLGPGIINTSKLAASAVTAEKIRNNVITTNKLNNKSVTAAKIAEKGVSTGNLAESAVTTGKLADGAVTAAKLAPEVLNNVQNLKSGQTERGFFDIGGWVPSTEEAVIARGSISFQQALASYPNVEIIRAGSNAKFTANCPGLGTSATNTQPNPTAAPGYLCVYLTVEAGLNADTPLALDSVPNRLGVGLVAKSIKGAKGEFAAQGVWAVTAP